MPKSISQNLPPITTTIRPLTPPPLTLSFCVCVWVCSQSIHASSFSPLPSYLVSFLNFDWTGPLVFTFTTCYMAGAVAMLSLFLFIFMANGVHSFEEKKTFNLNLNLPKLQRKHKLACLLPQSRREKGAVVLEMKDRRHCSEAKKNVDWRVKKELGMDAVRVRAIQNRIRKASITASSETEIPLTTGMKLQTLNYVVTVGLGGQNMSVIVDTGSDLTWVQCGPCDSCYNQQGPLFRPSASPSFQSILCNSTTCQSLRFATGNSQACGGGSGSSSSCNYAVNYGDGSYSAGELGVEELSFGGAWVSNLVFGCGRNNKGLFGAASGLMGLGRSDLSLVSQTNATFGGVFSYCLPDGDAAGSLIMGAAAALLKNVTPVAYTPMVSSNPQLSNFYILNLTGISVGGVALEAASGLGNGIVIDSGTVITRVGPSVYRALKAEFVKQFAGYPGAPGFSILDTCFNLSGYEEVKMPSIRMRFEGDAEVEVDASGVLYVAKEDGSRVCLAIASLSDEYETGILGNYQQRNQRVIYDTTNNRLGFAPEPCAFPFT